MLHQSAQAKELQDDAGGLPSIWPYTYLMLMKEELFQLYVTATVHLRSKEGAYIDSECGRSPTEAAERPPSR